MQKTTEQAGEWQAIWERRGLLDSIIDAGRSVYNFFFWSVLRRYITPQTNMLELGCGRASLSLSLCLELHSLTGIDISETAVRQATDYARQQDITNARFAVGDCTDLKLKETFDFVWSQGLIEHFDDPAMVAREHYKVLAPGGTVLISVPHKYSYHALWYKSTRPIVLRGLWPWTEQCFFSANELGAIGRAITPHSRVFLLQPFPLGIIFLEMHKPAHE